MLKEILFKLLGIDKKNEEVREIKKELKQETTNMVRRTNKLNTVMVEQGVTSDIAHAMGFKI